MGRNIVGRSVRAARRGAKPPITQSELAARLQVMGLKMDQATLSRIESGARLVFDYEALALAKALGIPVGSLFEEP